ncbi:MAG: phosphoribosylpyrophosphate synthetase [Cytophagales bacterium]|nr:phosphoribosylpyrophosphate synthetase [Cytophagales bacterium]
MTYYTTSSEAMTALKKKGYTEDLNLHPEWIECPKLDLRLKPEEFHVDEVYRFEGMNNPADSEILYAISSTRGVKGLLIDAYGVYADAINPEMVRKLTIDSRTKH